MELQTRLDALRQQILELGERTPQHRYPCALRQQIVETTSLLLEHGFHQRQIALFLDLPTSTLCRWLHPHGPARAPNTSSLTAFAPVHLNLPAADEHGLEPRATVEIVLPSGLKLAGLSLEQARQLMQELSCS